MFPNPLSIRLRLFNFKSPREWTGRHSQKTFANCIALYRESQRNSKRFTLAFQDRDSFGQQESACGNGFRDYLGQSLIEKSPDFGSRQKRG
ncbi:MAG: hypothetical protein DMG38_22115 [Acidobacteria bacterium]|nr:MAG: hypothetical protein DMG38_22115 [Acidobacteriota bacterium]